MTDLKELIDQEIDQYLEWPTADKSHVTAVSAKLFAEHVARLYADHITDAGKMVAPAVQGEPVAVVDADDDGMWADILPDVTVKVGQALYTTPQPTPDVSARRQSPPDDPLGGLAFLPDGDANFYTLSRPEGHWVARIQFNGELYGPEQERILESMLGDRNVRYGDGYHDGLADAWRDQPDVAGLVEALEQGFPLLSDEGLDEVEHHCEWVIQRERKRVHSILAAHRKGGES